MSWKHETDANGQPMWSGVDFIVDPYWLREKDAYSFEILYWWGAMIALGIGIPFLPLMALGAAFSWHNPPATVVILTFMSLCAPVCFIELKNGKPEKPSMFITRVWALSAKGGKLRFLAGHYSQPVKGADAMSWSVALDEIARVESGPTNHWCPSREYPGGPLFELPFKQVSQHEYQTFLFLNDGSRRVILTSNADREGCGTLAASIRAWLEKSRAETKCVGLELAEEGFAL